MNFIISARCEQGHTEDFAAELPGKEWADYIASCIDGTLYQGGWSPIGTDSPVGKCGRCRTQLSCTVALVAAGGTA